MAVVRVASVALVSPLPPSAKVRFANAKLVSKTVPSRVRVAGLSLTSSGNPGALVRIAGVDLASPPVYARVRVADVGLVSVAAGPVVWHVWDSTAWADVRRQVWSGVEWVDSVYVWNGVWL